MLGCWGEATSSYLLYGDLQPGLMLHWRVQAYMLGHLSPEYRNLLPGLRVNGLPIRTFTMNRGPPTGLQKTPEADLAAEENTLPPQKKKGRPPPPGGEGPPPRGAPGGAGGGGGATHPRGPYLE